ncbi:hypothetical protein BDV96DRAFT_605181 [Lophiotrema nucula]|uniref:Uncharacterized protein n=1 Tax=Lophiotrema nucula TaxID=690887 RepID=A0A6A5YSQ9_9PLEO|nr:hypothetical protein BDV96DRAFT_605181 [Lophiotrema nucula]
MAGKRKARNSIRSDSPKLKRSDGLTPPRMLAAPASPFLALPRELRDQIYDHAWQQTSNFTIEYNQLTYSVRYGILDRAFETPETAEMRSDPATALVFVSQQAKANTSAKAGWLFANRQILHESIQQFQRKANWKVTIRGSNSTLPIWNTRSLIAPWTAQTLELDVDGGSWKELDSSGRNAISRVQFCERTISWFKQAGNRMHTSTLQHLKVHCGFRSFRMGFLQNMDGRNVAIDFKPLERLHSQKLRMVEFIMSFENSNVGHTFGPVELLFREEISRLGDYLLHGKARQYQIDDEGDFSSWVWRSCADPCSRSRSGVSSRPLGEPKCGPNPTNGSQSFYYKVPDFPTIYPSMNTRGLVSRHGCSDQMSSMKTRRHVPAIKQPGGIAAILNGARSAKVAPVTSPRKLARRHHRVVIRSGRETSPLASKFFQLPQKLRNMVYHELWKDTKKIKVQYRGAMFEVEYASGQDGKQQRSCLWIMANKQIMQEAMEQYQRESIWALEPWYLPKAPATHGLLLPWEGRTLQLKNLVANEYINCRGKTITARWRLDYPFSRLLSQIAKESGQSRPLKSEHLALPVYLHFEKGEGPCTVDDVNEMAVDLLSLECLAGPTLQSIMMSVTLNADLLLRCQGLFPTACDEMVRVMGILTHGRTGRVEIESDEEKGQYLCKWEACEPPVGNEVKDIKKYVRRQSLLRDQNVCGTSFPRPSLLCCLEDPQEEYTFETGPSNPEITIESSKV